MTGDTGERSALLEQVAMFAAALAMGALFGLLSGSLQVAAACVACSRLSMWLGQPGDKRAFDNGGSTHGG